MNCSICLKRITNKIVSTGRLNLGKYFCSKCLKKNKLKEINNKDNRSSNGFFKSCRINPNQGKESFESLKKSLSSRSNERDTDDNYRINDIKDENDLIDESDEGKLTELCWEINFLKRQLTSRQNDLLKEINKLRERGLIKGKFFNILKL